jgi:hypothetical protein
LQGKTFNLSHDVLHNNRTGISVQTVRKLTWQYQNCGHDGQSKTAEFLGKKEKLHKNPSNSRTNPSRRCDLRCAHLFLAVATAGEEAVGASNTATSGGTVNPLESKASREAGESTGRGEQSGEEARRRRRGERHCCSPQLARAFGLRGVKGLKAPLIHSWASFFILYGPRFFQFHRRDRPLWSAYMTTNLS